MVTAILQRRNQGLESNTNLPRVLCVAIAEAEFEPRLFVSCGLEERERQGSG